MPSTRSAYLSFRGPFPGGFAFACLAVAARQAQGDFSAPAGAV